MRRRLILAGMMWLAACARAEEPDGRARVFAASSLTDALNELGGLYAATGRARPRFNYAASSTLARQIDQGAEADLFLSADEAWMDYLAARGRLVGLSRVRLLSNRLVLIAPADRPLRIEMARGLDLRDALGGGRLAIADPDTVPAGRYARAALQHLGAWEAVARDAVRAENVRAALRFVELGEAAAGVVYRSDALASARIAIAGEFPDTSHPPISYPMALIRGGRVQAAGAFAAFLQGAQAGAVFTRLGFIVQ